MGGITYKVAVYAPAERADTLTLPISSLSLCMYSLDLTDLKGKEWLTSRCFLYFACLSLSTRFSSSCLENKKNYRTVFREGYWLTLLIPLIQLIIFMPLTLLLQISYLWLFQYFPYALNLGNFVNFRLPLTSSITFLRRFCKSISFWNTNWTKLVFPGTCDENHNKKFLHTFVHNPAKIMPLCTYKNSLK